MPAGTTRIDAIVNCTLRCRVSSFSPGTQRRLSIQPACSWESERISPAAARPGAAAIAVSKPPPLETLCVFSKSPGILSPARSRAGLALLQLLQRLGPVAPKELREGAVGEELAAGLALRAVVRFVVGVDDPLHRRPAVGARLPVTAMDRHPFAEGRDLLREGAPGVGDEPVAPLLQRLARGAVEAPDLL